MHSAPVELVSALAMNKNDLVRESVWRTARLQEAYAAMIWTAASSYHQASRSATRDRHRAGTVFYGLAHENRNAAAAILSILHGRPARGSSALSAYDDVDRLLEPCRNGWCPLEDEEHYGQLSAERERCRRMVEALDARVRPRT